MNYNLKKNAKYSWYESSIEILGQKVSIYYTFDTEVSSNNMELANKQIKEIVDWTLDNITEIVKCLSETDIFDSCNENFEDEHGRELTKDEFRTSIRNINDIWFSTDGSFTCNFNDDDLLFNHRFGIEYSADKIFISAGM